DDDNNKSTEDFVPWNDPKYPIIAWLRGFKGGFFKDSLEIRTRSMLPAALSTPDDTPQEFGIFALQDIPEDTTLMMIPREAILEGDENDKEDPLCADVRTFVEAKSSSLRHLPFTKFVLDENSPANLRNRQPGSWSKEAQNILWDLLGEGIHPQPEAADHSYELDCVQGIQRGQENRPPAPQGKRLYEEAYKYFIAKSRGAILIPLFELIQHRGGEEWRNVALQESLDGRFLRVAAYRDIAKGEQLYKSFNRCDFEDGECETWDESFTPTEDIFRDTGAVEDYPRRWMMDCRPGYDRFVSVFDIDKRDDGSFVFEWLNGAPTIFETNFMLAQYEMLQAKEPEVQKQVATLSSAFERNAILTYLAAVKEALHLAWLNRNGNPPTPDEDLEENNELEEYDPFEEPKGAGTHLEDYFMCYVDRDCAGGEWDETFLTSMYQDMKFKHCPQTENSCLSLVNVIQACTSFRPHYHESFVHVPAQYAKEMKRVAYLGGGDNILDLLDLSFCAFDSHKPLFVSPLLYEVLHEIMKYPDLELVVGLELDQTVVRYSFKHFGTSPYFHDPRVQWWFGDASKSFLALPREYFGTFDLVIVDLLSFIADTLKVTEELSLMDAASLLMKPEGGIIVKQEDFSVHLIEDKFAKYTVDLEFTDLPWLCRQHITMGSNTVDFIKAKQFHHGIKTFVREDYLPQSDNGQSSLLFPDWHEYHYVSDTSCPEDEKAASVDIDSALSEEKPQFGVLLVIETEVLATADPTTDFEGIVNTTASSFGLSPIDTTEQIDFNQSSFLSLFQEGYVATRAISEARYVGFDVMLWEKLDKVDEIKNSLVIGVGGDPKTSTTSFRIVSGGMMGLGDGTCQGQELSNIAERAAVCQAKESMTGISQDSVFEETLVEKLVSSMLPITEDAPVLLVVLCGNKDADCPSLKAASSLLSQPNHGAILPIFTCDSTVEMSRCQSDMRMDLVSRVSEQKKINSIIVDASAAIETCQLLHKILADTESYEMLLEEKHVVLSPVPNGQSWRSVFVDRFRTELGSFFSPSQRVDFRFHKQQRVGWCIFVSEEANFLGRLMTALNDVQRVSGSEFEVDAVENGVNKFVVDFQAPVTLRDSEYDKKDASNQWSSQRAVGYQAVIQMEQVAPRKPLKRLERVLIMTSSDGPWDRIFDPATILDVEADGSGALVKFDVPVSDADNVEFFERERILRRSPSVGTDSMRLRVGDVVLFETGFEGTFRDSMISAIHKDEKLFDLVELNYEGKKHYDVPKDKISEATESQAFFEEIPPLTIERILIAFKNSLLALGPSMTQEEKMSIAPSSFPVGIGYVAVANWSGGRVVLKWNGKERIEANLFLDNENRAAAAIFRQTLADSVGNLKAVMLDEFPRGYGKIVNFQSDLTHPPHWLLK
ncbi:MAG: hypothetical protein SGILL_003260, partial [Bacillariaceae sp.]